MEIHIIIFIASLAATFLSVMSGGGSSIITIPVYLWAGLSLPLAIAVNKISAVFFTPISAYNYLKDRKINWKFFMLFAVIGLIGAFFGVFFVLSTNDQILKLIIGSIILIFVIYVYFKKDLGLKEKKESSKIKRALAYIVALPMGFYESIIGSGNGIAFAVLTFHTRGFDLIDALGYYFGISFFWATFASILYIQQGFFDLGFVIASASGAVIGSYLGSRYAKHKGNKFIKMIFIIVGAILGLKLILNL